MNTVALILFILALAGIVYTYIGYPVVLYMLSRWLGRPVRAADITPKLSVIIAAYNEAKDIARKLDETLALDYPQDKLEIVVASDCSTDGTDDIVRAYAQRGVILHRRPQRLGKTSAQNHAVGASSGEILIFSDATTHYEADALRKIVRSFADPQVGAVTGNVVYVDRNASDVGLGARSYWGYEFFLKQCESLLGSLLGVCGCLYAVRRSSYAQLDEDMSSDFVIASEIYKQGLRTIYDPQAISSEDTNQRGREEFRMRVRIIEQTMSALYRYRALLNPVRHGMYAFQMWSHKVMRYVVPFLLIAAFDANALLVSAGAFFQYLFIGQMLFYGAALVGWLAERLDIRLGKLAIPYYFVLANAASLIAFLKFVGGQSHVTWEPLREGKSPAESSPYQVTMEHES
ncbi:MAG: glycosyltransferase family 2 protein [Acidobacteria bacterium]|nr:glycosyltransferase family 2 protein [Acidobacteriota bacterium]